ncbi:MAG: flavoprotein [Collinsella sp.]
MAASNNSMQLEGKTILLGITGGIAAYKSCNIVRLLQKRGAHVKVVMSEHATEFVARSPFVRSPTSRCRGPIRRSSDPIHTFRWRRSPTWWSWHRDGQYHRQDANGIAMTSSPRRCSPRRDPLRSRRP